MNQHLIYMLIAQLILFTIGIITIIFIIRQTYAIRLEKRFDPFSLKYEDNHEISAFDWLLKKLWQVAHFISNLFIKSTFLNKYAKKYDRYLYSEDEKLRTSMDYIALKFIIGIFIALLYIITINFKHNKVNPLGLFITFILGFFILDIFLIISFKKKRRQIEDDLLKAIIIMNNCFKTGRNIMQAISAVKQELDGPIADEFKKIYLDITYGLSLDIVFNRFYERVKLEDARYIASSLTLLNKTGGNIIRVFAMIEKSIFDQKKLRNELNSLTAASVFVFRVLLFLPFIFVLIIYILNPVYFKPLFTSPLGIISLIIIIILFSLYVFTVKKVLKVNI